jgi:hypothetical protein
MGRGRRSRLEQPLLVIVLSVASGTPPHMGELASSLVGHSRTYLVEGKRHNDGQQRHGVRDGTWHAAPPASRVGPWTGLVLHGEPNGRGRMQPDEERRRWTG